MSSARAHQPDAELFLPPLVDANAVLVREAGLELLRRLVEDVGEHEPAGRRERRGRRRGKGAPRQTHPRAPRQQRRRVVRRPARRGGCRGRTSDRRLRGRPARRRHVGRLPGEIRHRRRGRPWRRRGLGVRSGRRDRRAASAARRELQCSASCRLPSWYFLMGRSSATHDAVAQCPLPTFSPLPSMPPAPPAEPACCDPADSVFPPSGLSDGAFSVATARKPLIMTSAIGS